MYLTLFLSQLTNANNHRKHLLLKAYIIHFIFQHNMKANTARGDISIYLLLLFIPGMFSIMSWGGKDSLLRFNSTIPFVIGLLGISRAFLVKWLSPCPIYHSLTCVMFQILVQRGYSWRQLSLCWAAIKGNISYLSREKMESWHKDKNYKNHVVCRGQRPTPKYINLMLIRLFLEKKYLYHPIKYCI